MFATTTTTTTTAVVVIRMRAIAMILVTEIVASLPALGALAVAPHVNIAPPGARQTIIVLVQVPLQIRAVHVCQREGTIANAMTKVDIARNGMLISTIGQSFVAKLIIIIIIIIVVVLFEIATVSIVQSLGMPSQHDAQEKESSQGKCKDSHRMWFCSVSTSEWM
jgi:hypothetical protein